MPDRKFIKTINDAYDVSSFYAVTQGARLFNNKKAFELKEATNSDVRREHFFTDEEKYHILRYLTNMLESKEAEFYKKIK